MSSSRNKGLLVVLVVGLVVAIAAVLAFGVTGGSNSDDATDDTTIDSSNGSSMSETQPVTVVGDPLTPFDTPQNDASIGSTPPTLEGFAFDGSSLSIAPGSTGRATMVVFLAHWCPHCNAEIPVLIEWNESGGVPANLAVIGVSTAVFDDRDNYPPSQWIDDKGFPWPVLADSENSEAAVAYGVTGFPTFQWVIGPLGNAALSPGQQFQKTGITLIQLSVSL